MFRATLLTDAFAHSAVYIVMLDLSTKATTGMDTKPVRRD